MCLIKLHENLKYYNHSYTYHDYIPQWGINRKNGIMQTQKNLKRYRNEHGLKDIKNYEDYVKGY